MADLIMIVDTAVTVPVNITPLIDDTDFKTRETAIAYDAAGMDLVWNFVTVAGVITQTAVTPTTSGSYDWTHVGDGIYKIEIPDTGGASINNDTEGFGWFSGVVTGVLPWRGPIIQFSPANVVNSLVVGSDKLEIDVAQFGGTNLTASGGRPEVNMSHIAGSAVSTTTAQIGVNVVQVSGDATAADNAEAFFDGTGYAGTNNVIPTVTTVNGLAAGTITAASIAADAITAAKLAADVTTELQSGLATASALATVEGKIDTIDGIVDNILLDTAEIGAAGAGLTALATQASVNTIDDFLDTEIAAIKAKTDSLTFTVAGEVNANTRYISGAAASADNLERSTLGIVLGTVGAASTTTSIVTSSLDPAAAVADQFKGKIVTFDRATTTANLRGQSTDITASSNTGVLTVTALTDAPVSGDTFVIT